jgi:hypothetical protein
VPTFTYGSWAQETVVPASRLIPVREDVDALQLAVDAAVSLRRLLEGTGDPAQVDTVVGLVEANGSVVAFAPRPVRRPPFRCRT